jgi:hypothetical protein
VIPPAGSIATPSNEVLYVEVTSLKLDALLAGNWFRTKAMMAKVAVPSVIHWKLK